MLPSSQLQICGSVKCCPSSLRATARYLNLAKAQLGGRDDYAVAGYHMGIGNLQSVLRDYGQDPGSYTALYFGSTPSSRPAAYRRLAGLGLVGRLLSERLGDAAHHIANRGLIGAVAQVVERLDDAEHRADSGAGAGTTPRYNG